MIGVFLEAMCSLGKETILESYYETALKAKYSRDNESISTESLAKFTKNSKALEV